VSAFADGVELAFTLPKGAYATVILRELLKSEEGESEPAAETDLAPDPSM
jgi:tRNA(Glu) U13 pseudouridine synthase TruD